MNLSPVLIKTQEFEKSMRGYNPEEVQAFLAKVSSEFEELINQNEDLNNEVEKLKSEIEEFRKTEKRLKEERVKTKETSSHETIRKIFFFRH